MGATVVVTPRSLSSCGHPALLELEKRGYRLRFPAPGKQPTEQQLVEAMADCVGYLAGIEPITRAVLLAAPKLKVISRNGSGADNVDMIAAAERGIAVKRALGANANGVAELTWGHILSAARGIHDSNAALKAHAWRREMGFELAGKTLGLVGCGAVGRRVARFALTFGMQVVAYDPRPDPSFNPGGQFRFDDFNVVLGEARVLSLHCPPDRAGPLIGVAELSKMHPGAVIVNTARAELLDRDAVLAALDTGLLRALTLDAFEHEPPQEWRLVDHPRVLVTTHIGGYTTESIERATVLAVENLLAVLDSGNGPTEAG